ncbi:DUF4330 domain-containing protein [Halosimplex rubrum]|uniref:DUF4330 domain-containing protein n=1 Tax=Halosimplex rubrum TaxID=869889 RepID=A0A7D5T3B9_9EURY|nr:DUF4330 domain-containing protein [Halosimplex rubrum]QLH76770.1 DUF4330 domain-containing protein [Halosimplex rubrum]
MTIIDESGRLFGRVNVYDALVVVVLVGALGAGVLFVDPFPEGGDPAARYATVDLGQQPLSTAARIAEGNDSGGALAVTDAYVGPGDGDTASVVVRVRVNGTLVDDPAADASVFEFGGETLRRGDNLTLETAAYDAEGEVVELGAANTTLETGRLPVLVEASVPPATAALVDRGDGYRLDDRTVATVTETTVASAGGGNRTAMLGLSLRTVRYGGGTYFGDRRVLVGQTVPFRTERYALSGSVTRWGNASLPGEPASATAVVRLDGVEPDIADGLEAGMVERRDGTTLAEITDVRSEPASVVLTSEDGNIYEREHPRNEDVYLTVDLRVRRTDDGLRFRTRPVREGSNVLLDFRTVAVDGTVVDVGA